MNKRGYLRVLNECGLKPNEAKLYLACLQLGEAAISRLSEASELPRTLCYPIITDLIDRGIFSRVKGDGVQRVSAISIDALYALQQQRLEEFAKALPELRSIQTLVGDTPNVQYLAGIEGIKAAFEDTINHTTSGGEILIYTTAEGYYEEQLNHFESYVRRRIAKNISVRFIGTNTQAISLFTENAAKELRSFKLVPAETFPFANEINIYGNRLAIMNLRGEPLAVIIESESIAQTQRSIFELAWRGADSL